MSTRWKGMAVWVVCFGWLMWLGHSDSGPGCVCIRDEQGKPVLIACRFAGATLGPALILLACMLPVVVQPLITAKREFSFLTGFQAVSILIAWVYLVRWDLQSLGPEGVASLLVRGRYLYGPLFGISALVIVVWNWRTTRCSWRTNRNP